MAWTAPMTAVENAVYTSAQYNTYVRDNLLQTAPALATAAGQIPVGLGLNSIAMRTPVSSLNPTNNTGTTTSTSFTPTLSDGGGPAVTATTGTRALVLLSALIFNNTNNGDSFMGVAVSGATTIAADGAHCLHIGGITASNWNMSSAFIYFDNTLTAGSNTFTTQYEVSSGTTGSFGNRCITVIPL